MFLSLRGFRTYYDWFPHPKKQILGTIVLLHGAGLSSAIWEPILSLLTESYAVLAYDIAGHGQSEDDLHPLSFQSMAEDLLLLLRSLTEERVILIAHDTGAYIAERFAWLYPDQVACTVLISPLWPAPLAAMRLQLEARISQLERADSMRHYADLRLPALSSRAAEIPHMAERIRDAFARVSRRLYRQLLESAAAAGFDMTMRAGIHQPLLLIGGEQDPGFPPSLAYFTSQLSETASTLIIPDAASLVFVDEPAYTADFIDRFVRRLKRVEGWKPHPLELELRKWMRSHWENGLSPAAAGRPQIRIRCIGQFEVAIGGEFRPHGWNTRHAKSLLVYLAFHRSATREQLCDALFPEKDFSQAMNNLRVYLSHFAKLLESPEFDTPCLTIGRDAVKLNFDVDCDLISLLKQLQLARDTEDSVYRYSMCRLLLEKLQGKILPGCYDPFSLKQKDTVELLWESLSLWAADYGCSQGQYMEAVAFLHSGLQYGTGDELLFYERLIGIYRRTGNAKEMRKWQRLMEKLL
ncbi:Lysophospholipase, alpha-beta hydrolase superfamily [Paenibacillus sp. UNCCL117]|uniref:alpha/beta hydrolase n=1 Tax=unclassified Paenibacillus TaxID=185978 RepID=UPI0008835B27|nr:MULTISPECIES: alpha/beta hydrolase [unclassified Paenibacillus]SDC03488.1 Lysophospholipase, alpha-beta hydrolase superfamily [Paenibacillus sp. cl123]SFW37089.1 Lysophospholipase, alpha-beta hydrolase superfamily [Paenibacillus sp. UNCCL117]